MRPKGIRHKQSMYNPHMEYDGEKNRTGNGIDHSCVNTHASDLLTKGYCRLSGGLANDGASPVVLIEHDGASSVVLIEHDGTSSVVSSTKLSCIVLGIHD